MNAASHLRHMLAAVLAAAAVLVMGPAAAAPSRAELAAEIETLRAELAAVKDDLAALRKRTELPDSATRLLADLVARMEHIERQMAGLNGRLEEQEHAVAELKSRLDRLAADFQARLLQLESGAPSATAPAAAAAPAGGSTPSAGAPEAASVAGPARPAEGPKLPDDPQKAYDAAFALLRQGDFAAAEAAFRAFLERFAGHELAANAQYWLGETYYVRKDYARAAEAFLKGYQDYRDRPKAADSLLKLAMSLASLGNREEACAALAELASRYPDASTAVRQRAAAQRRQLACP
ncbi:MAG: tol-pal system protein YbgF [Rhodothalassiaceae bacterium]|nr:MAG: tol-pal system protein YbgF [Rhodothalassiaceae bacterium]